MQFECGKDECENFNLITTREWIEANSKGCYASSTLCGMNRRRHHGLFVVPLASNNNRAVILSKFEESVFIDNRVYELSTNQYTGGIYPDGYKHLSHFSINPFPKFIFEIEDRKIEKTLFLLHDRNTLVLRYCLKNQGSPVKLILKPVLAGRPANELTKDIQGVNTDSYIDEGVVKLVPRPHLPEMSIYFSKGEYLRAPLWYHNYTYTGDYSQEKEERIDEDLFNPGFFNYILEPYESFDLYVSTDPLMELDYESLYRKEKEYRRQIINGNNQLPTIAKEISKTLEMIHIKSETQKTVWLPNLHWGEITLREYMLSLFGLMVSLNNYEEVKESIVYLLSCLDSGLLPVYYQNGSETVSYQAADCSLIFINLCYFYYRITKDINFVEEHLMEPFRQIIEAFQKGTQYNIYQDKDGLIFSGDKNVAVSWMPVFNQDGKVIRYGKLTEVNALWYNALCIMQFFSEKLQKSRPARKYQTMAKKTKTSFMQKFWDNEKNILYDLVRDDVKDATFRLNQIIVLACPFQMLSTAEGTALLEKIEQELLTPYGLRTLSPLETNYIGKIDGTITRNHPHYFSGAVWPWTIGLYSDAVFTHRGKNKKTIKYIENLLKNFDDIYYSDSIGYLPELLDGDQPHQARGAAGYSLALTEMLRVYKFIQHFNRK